MRTCVRIVTAQSLDEYLLRTHVRIKTAKKSFNNSTKIYTIHHFKARKEIDRMKTRLYTKEQVIQAVEEALRDLDTTSAPEKGQMNLDNDIPQNSSPVNTRVTLTVPEAAELIGICKPKMYEMVRAGKVRSIKAGKKILISRQSLMGWLKRGDSYEEAC